MAALLWQTMMMTMTMTVMSDKHTAAQMHEMNGCDPSD